MGFSVVLQLLYFFFVQATMLYFPGLKGGVRRKLMLISSLTNLSDRLEAGALASFRHPLMKHNREASSAIRKLTLLVVW